MTDLENKVRAACADTTWGASGSDLMQIAQGTYSREDYALIMSVVWQRLGSSRWRCVYKALEVLKYLCMHGSSRCLEDARAALHHIQTLEHYRFVDPGTHRDEGENVRARARTVVAMISDQAVLDEEREKDKALRAKLGAGTGSFGGSQGGISSADYHYGSRSGGSGGGGYGGSNNAVHTSYSGGGAGGSRGDTGSRSSRYDDEPRGGYDDEPRGAFGALSRNAAAGGASSSSAMEQSVDDLLGSEGNGAKPSNGQADEDDDEDFNPRAASAVATTNGGGGGAGAGAFDLESILGGLDASSTGNSLSLVPSAGTGNGGAVPMSQLVQNLAAQRQTPVQQIEAPPASRPAVGAQPVSASAFGGLSPTKTPGVAGQTTPSPSSTPATAPLDAGNVEPAKSPALVPLKKKVADPFADLLSTAKNNGVL